MTPQEQAKQLVDKFFNDYGDKEKDGSVTLCIVSKGRAKQCALIAVEAINDAINTLGYTNLAYWQEVKKEIEQL